MPLRRDGTCALEATLALEDARARAEGQAGGAQKKARREGRARVVSSPAGAHPNRIEPRLSARSGVGGASPRASAPWRPGQERRSALVHERAGALRERPEG